MGVFQEQPDIGRLVVDVDSTKAIWLMLGVGSLSALSFSFEAILIRWL